MTRRHLDNARRRRIGPFPAGLVAAAIAAAPAAGQNDSDLLRRIERQMRELDSTFRLAVPADQPISERLLLDYGGSLRFGFLAVDAPSGNTRFLRQTDGILSLRAELDGAHRFYGRLRFEYNDFNSGDSFDGEGDDFVEPIGDRYWYEFDARGAHLARTGTYLEDNINVKVGRQSLLWGAGLAFYDVLYAVRVDGEIGDLGVRGLAGVTPSTSTVDFDGSRPGFDRNTDRVYYGGMLEWRASPRHRPYFSFLGQRDHNERNLAVIAGIPTQFEYDSEYWALGSRGTLGPQMTYRIELVYESGRGRSNSFDSNGAPIAQTDENISAWAGVIGLSYLFRDANDTRLDFEFAGGSGDEDRIDSSDTFGGNRTGTNDNAFNGLGYLNTGLALAPELSNLLSLRLGVSTSPFGATQRNGWIRTGVTGFLFAKADDAAPLNVRTTASTFVGGELDFFVDWRLTSDLSASLRYGIFLPGDAMPPAENDARHFFYAGITYAF